MDFTAIADNNTDQPPREIEQCENCARTIGRLEHPHLWEQHVVCSDCWRTLSSETTEQTLRKGRLAALIARSNENAPQASPDHAETSAFQADLPDYADQLTLAQHHERAAAGDPTSMNRIAILYSQGKGVGQDAVKAMAWFQRAAAAGSSAAMRNIGALYAAGRGVPRDASKAFTWFQRAAEAGDVTAMAALGYLYEEGRGIEADVQQAIQWYERAAVLGDVTAMYALGRLFEKGHCGSFGLVYACR